jgi:hypothetical protein
MRTPAAALVRSDFLRAPVLWTARPEGYKEWHHFVVHRPGLRLLVNFSLTAETPVGGPPRLTPRVIVIAHEERWTGTVTRFAEAPEVSPDLSTLVVGPNRMSVRPDGYRVTIDLPERDTAGELHLRPGDHPPVVLVNNQPLSPGRLNWLFVPRLRADGWFRTDGREHRFAGDVAYHDHNWGRFRWGDDFGWSWASVLPADPGNPWSFVLTQMTDLRRLRTLAQALYVWRHDEPAALFRDAAVRMRSTGRLARAADCTLPPVMGLVLGGDAADVPRRVTVTARQGGDRVHAEFDVESYARVVHPNEVSLDRAVVLVESGASVRAEGRVGEDHVDFRGSGVLEVLHG